MVVAAPERDDRPRVLQWVSQSGRPCARIVFEPRVGATDAVAIAEHRLCRDEYDLSLDHLVSCYPAPTPSA